LGKLAWVALALVLLGAAFLVAIRELGANGARHHDEIVRFEMAVDGVLPAPLSYSGERQNLLDCMAMADGIYGRLQTKAVLADMAATCAEAAEAALRSNPNYGFAALVLARLAVIGDDWDRFNRMLVVSQRGAPAEQWVSVERLRLYAGHEDRLDAATLVARQADIALLLASPIGIRSIAGLYVRNESLRELIAAEAEKLPAEVQNKFVHTVRNIIGS